jgi:hypothetical protein
LVWLSYPNNVKSLPPECGQPLAAINGDFYEKSQKYLDALAMCKFVLAK